MYKIYYNSKDLKNREKIEIENINQLFNIPTKQESVEELHFANLYDNLDYTIFILKPYNDDFLIIYHKSLVLNSLSDDFPENIKGTVFGEVFPKFKELGMVEKFKNSYFNDKRVDSDYQIFKDNKLLYEGHQFCVKQEDYLHVFLKNETSKVIDEREALKFKENFNAIEGYSKIFIGEYENGKYHFTSEIYHMLGVNPEDYPETVNVLEHFVLEEDRRVLEKFLSLTPENPEYGATYRLKNNNNNEIIYIYNQNKAFFNENGDLIRIIGFMKDVTHERLIAEKSERLSENINIIEQAGKTFIAEYENGEYHFNHHLYDFLGVKKEEYDNGEILIKNFVLPEDLPIYEDLMNISIDTPVKDGIYRVKTLKNEVKYLNVTNNGKFNDNGDLYRVVGLLQDVTRERLAKIEALELQDDLNNIGDFSKIFIATYQDGEFKYTDEFYNIIECDNHDYYIDVTDLVFPDDLKIIGENLGNISPENPAYNLTYRIKTLKGNVKYIAVYSKGIFNSEGELVKVVGFQQDVTEQSLLQKEAMELKENLEYIQKNSKIVISTFRDGKFYYTDEIYDILEINKEDYPQDIDLIELFVLHDKKGDFDKQLDDISISNPEFYRISTVKTPNDNVKYLEGYIKGKFNSDGGLVEIVGFIHEVTDRVNRENELKQLSEDRKVLLQEVHHRVKNNFQLILSFLSLDSHYNKDDPEYLLSQTRNRIEAMALTHEQVYKSNSVSTVNLKEFLIKEIDNLFNLYSDGNIKVNYDIDPVEVNIDTSVPLGLLVNELTLNNIKYAFPDNCEGNFYVSLNGYSDYFVLEIWDDGVGLKEGINLFKTDSLGFLIIRNLTKQIDGKLSLLEKAPGFGIKIISPIIK
jgi:two-component sensor histidine kinase